MLICRAQKGVSLRAQEGTDGSDMGMRAEKVDLSSYAEVVRKVLPETDRYVLEFVVKNGVADVSVPEDLMIDVEPLWKSFVVGYFMNDAQHIGTIHSTVNRFWSAPGKVSKIDVQFLGKKRVLFRVDDDLLVRGL
ncbi:unnamed protein product [Brassica rapa subsp. trilocularis]